MLRQSIKHWQLHRKKYLLLVLVAGVAVILWNSFVLFQQMKEQEREKMELWAEAEKRIIEAPVDADVNLPIQIVIKNKTIPVIMTDSTGKILQTANLPETVVNDPVKLQKNLNRFQKENEPIIITLDKGNQYLYYGNSTLLRKLTWYPLVFILIFLLFVGIIYLYYYTSRISEQNRLWAGMAKEAAHQIGTPLSSLMGWVELMKTDPSLTPVEELQKDIHRLKVISNRFGKIGSIPQLEPRNIHEEIKQTVLYFQSRIPKNILLEFKPGANDSVTMLNADLFQWVMENLIKNAIDAMPSGGKITIETRDNEQEISISVIDHGKGIPRKNWKKIFEPGFSTKTRGWGLGLSVVKRIIKNYHHGTIFIKKSVINQGTEFVLKLKKWKKS